MKRKTKCCDKCNKEISLSNFNKHFTSCNGIIIENKINEEWKQENNKYKCPHCNIEFSKKGIGTHIWKRHTIEGQKQNPNIGFINGDRIIWNKGLTKETNDSLKNSGIKIKENFETGKYVPSFTNKTHKKETKIQISKKLQQFCENIENRERLRDIGRKGGYGKKGYINGIYYASSLEKQCFEWLQQNNIEFEPHKNIPNSSKVSDIYLIDKDLWIELDGINREQKKKWLGKDYDYWITKLKIYEEQKLNYKICYNLEELKLEV